METTPPDVPPSPSVPLPDPPATWPNWFRSVDLAFAGLVLATAFLVASFAARNSDLWLHLATGRLLIEGGYSPGHDPFSVAERPWADSSWLFSLGVFALHRADPSGALLVVVKAALFAVAFGLLALLRRSGHALWHWAAAAAVGVVASAFYVPVRPVVVSVLFLSITLVLLFRVPWRTDSWRPPLRLAALFALWANLDPWFLLGPLTVALVLLGEKLHMFVSRDDEAAADTPFPTVPPAKQLLRALALGLAACLLNPMVLAAAVNDPIEAGTQLLPWEFGFHTPATTEDDIDLELNAKPVRLFDERPNTFLWFHPNQPDEEIKVNAVAYFLLACGSLVVLTLGYRQLHATHLVLWVGFTMLSLTHVRFIPVFAVVAVSLAAMYLNLLVSRIRLAARSETRTRVLLTSSSLGRVLSVIGAVLLLAATYPGWLHPRIGDKLLINRVEWVVEPDPGQVRAARELARLRSQGLSADVRGMSTSPTFGDYCAWSAPGEKSFTTSRFGFHLAELPDLLTVRAAMGGRRSKTTAVEFSDVARVCENRGIGFLTMVSSFRPVEALGVFELLESDSRWVLAHLDGRAAIVGRSSAFDPLRYNPVAVAFASNAGALPIDPLTPPPVPPEDSWDEFLAVYLHRPPAPSLDVEDAVVLSQYQSYLTSKLFRRILPVQLGGVVASPMAAEAWALRHLDPRVEDARMVLPLLTVRAARQAIAATPDRPEAYWALAVAYRQEFAPALDTPLPIMGLSEQQLQIIAASARCLARVPGPETATINQARLAVNELLQIADLYTRTQQFDFALQAYKKALAYTRLLPTTMLWELNPQAAGQPLPEARAAEFRTEFFKSLESQVERREKDVDQRTEQVLRHAANPAMRFLGAARLGLPGLALKTFRETVLADFGANRDAVLTQALLLELRAGQLEQAAAHMTELDADIKRLLARDPQQVSTFRTIRSLVARLAGDIRTALAIQNETPEPKLPPELLRLAVTTPDVPLAIVGGSGLPIFAAQFMGARVYLSQEAGYQYDRAMLALLNGNPTDARQRLEMAIQPKGIDVDKFGGDPTGRIQKYLDLLRRFEGKN